MRTFALSMALALSALVGACDSGADDDDAAREARIAECEDVAACVAAECVAADAAAAAYHESEPTWDESCTDVCGPDPECVEVCSTDRDAQMDAWTDAWSEVIEAYESCTATCGVNWSSPDYCDPDEPAEYNVELCPRLLGKRIGLGGDEVCSDTP